MNSIALGTMHGTHRDGDISARNSGTIGNCYDLTSDSSGSLYFNHATDVTMEQLTEKDLYSFTLHWLDTIWNFNNVNIEEGKYPTLYQK